MGELSSPDNTKKLKEQCYEIKYSVQQKAIFAETKNLSAQILSRR